MGIGIQGFHWALCPVPESYGNGGRLPDGRDTLECRSGAVSGFGNGFKSTGVGIRDDVGIRWTRKRMYVRASPEHAS